MREITPTFEGPSRHFDRGARARFRSTRARRVLISVGVCAVLAIHIAAGVRGVGFGTMWDEGEQMATLHQTVAALKFTPASYYYGGIYQLPGFLALVPTVLPHVPQILAELKAKPTQPFAPNSYPSIVAAQADANAQIDRPEFRSLDRGIFVCLVSLIVVWVFIASRRVSGSPWASLAAAAATGLSWELSYHGRWIAADALQAQFGALAIASIILALDAQTPARQRMWMRLAAVATGLSMSCKVLGMFLLLPIAVAIWVTTRRQSFRRRLLVWLEACAIAFAAFAATTPGLLLDPIHYANDVFHVQHVYATMFDDDYPFTEPFVLVRLAKIAGYVALVLLSPYSVAAVAFLGLAILGAIVGLRERRAKVVAVVTFVVVYLAFLARQRVFVARNVLIVLPMLAILMSLGISRAASLLRRWRFGPPALALALSIMFVANARWIWHTAGTVGTTTDASIGREVIDYIAARPKTKFYISPSVMALLRGYHGPDVAALHIQSASWAEADDVVISAGPGCNGKTNVPHSGTYFASLHANFDYYPSLLTYADLAHYGTPVVVLPKARAAARGVKDGQ